MILDIVKTALGWLWSAFGAWRRVRVKVHRAILLRDQRDCYFINVTNCSQSKDVVITHIWFDSNPKVHVMNPDRPLPVRLKPDEPWETWVEASRLPPEERSKAYNLGRARLSTGKVIKSKENKGVPSIGDIPGGLVK
jgi:hypothetical protein